MKITSKALSVSRRKLDIFLDELECWLRDGWSLSCALGKSGINYPGHAVIQRVLNKDTRYRLMVMKYYPEALNIRKWIKEFDDLPATDPLRLERDYSRAIQDHSRFEMERPRASGLHHEGVSNPPARRVEHRLRKKALTPHLDANPRNESGAGLQGLPTGVRTVHQDVNIVPESSDRHPIQEEKC